MSQTKFHGARSPLNISFKTEAPSLAIVLAGIITAIVSYDRLPVQVISHWDFYGTANGWMSRQAHTLLFMGLLIGMYLLFLVLPNLDPKKDRYKEFAKAYFVFRTAILGLFYIVFLLATLVNLGYPISISKTVPLLIGLLMILLGNYMGKIKKNWFVGIRTPWTLSSENVWNKTHRLGGKLFVLFGLILIVTPFLTKVVGITLFIFGLILITIVPMAYSYLLYRQEQPKK
jgi:uncharacterized membrane protein